MQKLSKKIVIVALMSLTACTTNQNKRPNEAPENEQTENIAPEKPAATNFGYFIPDGDSLIIPTFDIEINLSPKAKARLSKKKETIIVSASFSGIPKDTTSRNFRDFGEMGIAGKDIEIKNENKATFKNIKFAKSLYDSLSDKDIQLLINVFSGRHSSPDNLLNCGIIQKKISEVKGRTFNIECKLIYGED